MSVDSVLAVILAFLSLSAAADAREIACPAPETATLRAHMEFLASDALNGRGSGSRDEWITATYIAAELRREGLEPLGDDGDYVQTVQLSRTEVAGTPTLAVGNARLSGEDIFVRSLNAAEWSAPLQHYEPGAAVLPGAALLLPQDADPRSILDSRQAAVLLTGADPRLRSRWKELTARPITVGATRIVALLGSRATVVRGPSLVALSDAAYARVAALPAGAIASMKVTTHEIQSSTWNAAGRLVGSDPALRGQAILLTAHLDHLGARTTGVDRIYNGADDDASGSTAVLMLAEALEKCPPLKRSVVFAWFGSEEVGGYGAAYFVDRPTIPVDSIVANLEFEMIGRPDPSVANHTLWLTGWGRTNLGPELAAHGARLVQDPHPAENFFMRSDNYTLARRGIIAQTVSSFGLHADYHQPSDDLSRIDFSHMTIAIQSLVEPIRWLATSAFRPAWEPGGRPE